MPHTSLRAAVQVPTWEVALDWFLGVPASIVLIILGAWIIRFLIHRVIDRFVDSVVRTRSRGETVGGIDMVSTDQLPLLRRYGRRARRAIRSSGIVATQRQQARVTTLGSVMRSAASVIIWTTAVLMIGGQLGLNMAPLIASAGVGGVALGFGAQSLVKDFLSGLFMMLEDQYGVGDIVDTGDVTGTVEEVTLRVTRVRDADGVVWYVRNGEILRVANKSQGWTTGIVDIPVAPDESAERVIEALTQQVAGMHEEEQWRDVLLEAPTVAGVESITAGAMTIRLFAKCAPNQHWGVQREIRERAQAALTAAGVRPAIAPVLPGSTTTS